ncbi:MAG: type II toxin-antitoxin system VapC family toxin [Lentisphaerae bacterium]|nr:type II toxin-antitoxin system VapC family toxin [Lentisphaerota bacterium]
MKRVMLDTNAYSALLSGDPAVRAALESATEILLPLFVVGELEAGFCGGLRYAENVAILQRFLDKPGVREVPAGHETAHLYGKLKDGLKRKGTPIPENDIWIAASVIEHAAELITYDRHFTTLHNIRIWDHLGRNTA